MARESAEAPAPTSERRPMLAVLVLLAGSAGLGLVAAARPWATVTDPSSLAVATSEVSGGDLVAYASPILLVALAAAPAIAVMRVIGRRIVGVVVAILGLVLVVGCVRVATDLDGAARRWARVGDGVEVTTAPAWPVGTAVVALIVVVAAVMVVTRAPGWPGLSTKYERQPTRRARSGADAGPRGDADDPPGDGATSHHENARRDDPGSGGSRSTWDALDRGDDPTRSSD